MKASLPALRSTSFAVTALALATASGLASTPSTANAAGPLDAFLPKSGRIEGHIVRLSVAPEDQAIDRQFRTAVQNNMDWFKKYVTGQKSGAPLPYDPRMGITKEQYEKLQHMRAQVTPVAPFEASIAKAADGAVTFSSKDPAAAGLDKVTFGPEQKAAQTPYGKLDIYNAIHQTDPRAPFGAWTGSEWTHVAAEGSDEPSAKIAFGKRAETGEGLMYYQIAPYGDHKEQSLVVTYKLD